jgi:hypothetical protein
MSNISNQAASTGLGNLQDKKRGVHVERVIPRPARRHVQKIEKIENDKRKANPKRRVHR